MAPSTSIYLISACARDCNSMDGDEPGPPCIFPFYLEGQLYTECKWDSDDTNWCPTEVDSTARGLKWGMCGPGCPKLDSELLFLTGDMHYLCKMSNVLLGSVCETIGGNEPGKPCIFTDGDPECKFDPGDSYAYCYTTRKFYGGKLSKFLWGICGPGCPSKPTDSQRKAIQQKNNRIRLINGEKFLCDR
jgi:hypothetical protein